MYCRYDYNAGSTAANVMSDIVAILTGTTSTAGLSAACNKGTSVIISTVAAGWTVHDSAAGSGAQVLKAPFADASGYKYAYINFTSSNYQVQCAEGWNAGTHTGTNVMNAGTASAGYSLTAGGTIFIFAAATYLHFICFTGSTYGYLGSIMERTRSSLWDTAAVGVPPVVVGTWGSLNGTFTAYYYGCRTKSSAFVDVTTNSATYGIITLWGQNGGSSATAVPGPTAASKVPDAAGVPQFVTTDIYVSSYGRGDMGGQLYGIKHLSTGGNTSDDISVGGQTWFCVASAQLSSSYPAQSMSVALPKF